MHDQAHKPRDLKYLGKLKVTIATVPGATYAFALQTHTDGETARQAKTILTMCSLKPDTEEGGIATFDLRNLPFNPWKVAIDSGHYRLMAIAKIPKLIDSNATYLTIDVSCEDLAGAPKTWVRGQFYQSWAKHLPTPSEPDKAQEMQTRRVDLTKQMVVARADAPSVLIGSSHSLPTTMLPNSGNDGGATNKDREDYTGRTLCKIRIPCPDRSSIKGFDWSRIPQASQRPIGEETSPQPTVPLRSFMSPLSCIADERTQTALAVYEDCSTCIRCIKSLIACATNACTRRLRRINTYARLANESATEWFRTVTSYIMATCWSLVDRSPRTDRMPTQQERELLCFDPIPCPLTVSFAKTAQRPTVLVHKPTHLQQAITGPVQTPAALQTEQPDNHSEQQPTKERKEHVSVKLKSPQNVKLDEEGRVTFDPIPNVPNPILSITLKRLDDSRLIFSSPKKDVCLSDHSKEIEDANGATLTLKVKEKPEDEWSEPTQLDVHVANGKVCQSNKPAEKPVTAEQPQAATQAPATATEDAIAAAIKASAETLSKAMVHTNTTMSTALAGIAQQVTASNTKVIAAITDGNNTVASALTALSADVKASAKAKAPEPRSDDKQADKAGDTKSNNTKTSSWYYAAVHAGLPANCNGIIPIIVLVIVLGIIGLLGLCTLGMFMSNSNKAVFVPRPDDVKLAPHSSISVPQLLMDVNSSGFIYHPERDIPSDDTIKLGSSPIGQTITNYVVHPVYETVHVTKVMDEDPPVMPAIRNQSYIEPTPVYYGYNPYIEREVHTYIQPSWPSVIATATCRPEPYCPPVRYATHNQQCEQRLPNVGQVYGGGRCLPNVGQVMNSPRPTQGHSGSYAGGGYHGRRG